MIKASFFYYGAASAEPFPAVGSARGIRVKELRRERRITTFGFIIFILVLAFIGPMFSRPFYGCYRRPRIYPFGGFFRRGWGMGPHYHHHHGPMCHGPHHHHHHHHM